MTTRIINADMLEALPQLIAAGERFHAVVTDPPYHLTSIVKRFGATSVNGITKTEERSRNGSDSMARFSRGFMGQTWDGGDIAFRPETWRLVFDALLPGAHMLCFGGNRTHHRMACAIEDAGFEIRDQLCYLYGSGFPKGLNTVKQLIKMPLWQSSDRVTCAAQNSRSIQVKSEKAKAPIAVAFAQILPAGGLVLLTEIGGEVVLHVPTDMWPSGWEIAIGLSTIWSWNGLLDDAYTGTSKCITLTPSEMTIDQRISSWLIGLHTSAIITRCSETLQNGCEWPALSVALSLNGVEESKRSILIVTALGDASWNPVARFKGFNVALKPAFEPIILARKPLDGTVAANVLKHGCGALNIDASRIPCDWNTERGETWLKSGNNSATAQAEPYMGRHGPTSGSIADRVSSLGRWPANLLLDGSEEVLAAFAEYGEARPCKVRESAFRSDGATKGNIDFKRGTRPMSPNDRGDGGSAARFFWSSKADRGDRAGSTHPTVKPTDLMRYLVRLITPPGGTVLDPFAGTGSTGLAADQLGFDAVLIEQDATYAEDCRRKITSNAPLFAEVKAISMPTEQQQDMFETAENRPSVSP